MSAQKDAVDEGKPSASSVAVTPKGSNVGPEGVSENAGDCHRDDYQPSSLFTFRTIVKNTWHRNVPAEENTIQIVLDQGESPGVLPISDQVVPQLLFSRAPALKRDLFDRRVIIQDSPALDDEAINDVVNAILECAKKEATFVMNLQHDPVRMIKIHCVLERFCMQKEADALLALLWDALGSKELSLANVSWIWDTFADPAGKRWGRGDYIAPSAQKYLQMMAWQVVNMDAEGRLNADIKTAIQIEKEPKHFFDMLKKRRNEYGLGRERLADIKKTAAPQDGKLKQSTGGGNKKSTPREMKMVKFQEPVPANQRTEATKPTTAAPTESWKAFGGSQTTSNNNTFGPQNGPNALQTAENNNPFRKSQFPTQQVSKLTSTDFPKSTGHQNSGRFQAPAQTFGGPKPTQSSPANPSPKPLKSRWDSTDTWGGFGQSKTPQSAATPSFPSPTPAAVGFQFEASGHTASATQSAKPATAGFQFGGPSLAVSPNPFNPTQAPQQTAPSFAFGQLPAADQSAFRLTALPAGPSFGAATNGNVNNTGFQNSSAFGNNSVTQPLANAFGGTTNSVPQAAGSFRGANSGFPTGSPFGSGNTAPRPANAFGGSPFGDGLPFGGAQDMSEANNMFGVPSSASGGGMGRKFAKATGARRGFGRR